LIARRSPMRLIDSRYLKSEREHISHRFPFSRTKTQAIIQQSHREKRAISFSVICQRRGLEREGEQVLRLQNLPTDFRKSGCVQRPTGPLACQTGDGRVAGARPFLGAQDTRVWMSSCFGLHAAWRQSRRRGQIWDRSAMHRALNSTREGHRLVRSSKAIGGRPWEMRKAGRCQNVAAIFPQALPRTGEIITPVDPIGLSLGSNPH